MFYEGTKSILSEYVEKFSAFGKVSKKKFAITLAFYKISTLPNINFTKIYSTVSLLTKLSGTDF